MMMESDKKISTAVSSEVAKQVGPRMEAMEKGHAQMQVDIASIKQRLSAGSSGDGPAPGRAAGAAGAASAAGAAGVTGADEKRARTISFGQFPVDTKSANIIHFIEEQVKEFSEDVEEVFAYGKTRAERGGARFRSTVATWKYMKDNAGHHQHDYEGKKIYCNADSQARGEGAAREKAVRKVVRTIIEQSGGNSATTKAELETNYKKGVVWWKDERVAEWDEDLEMMTLTGAAAGFTAAFQDLMGSQ